MRLAISLGGDADTQAAIAGSIAEARFGRVPEEIYATTMDRLPEELRELVKVFQMKFQPVYKITEEDI